MYSLRYNFGGYNDAITSHMQALINNSSVFLNKQNENHQLEDFNHDADALAGSIQNVEEYLYHCYKEYPQEFGHILNSIINDVRTIAVLPSNRRGIYGESQVKNKIIYINPSLSDTFYLKGEERTRLYMAHELGHVINNQWMKKVIDYANWELKNGFLTKEDAQLIYDGFSMLDEATTQNRAEEFVYKFAKKSRPPLYEYKSKRLYNGSPFKSNFDYYRELQEPATMFARTLRGIGKINDDVQALNMLSKRALSPKFFDTILHEYTHDGQTKAFMQETQCMGLIKRASYANFGYEDQIYLKNSKNYFDSLKTITSKMKDTRDSIEDFER